MTKKPAAKIAGVERDQDGTFRVWDVEAVQVVGHGFKTRKSATKAAQEAGYEVR